MSIRIENSGESKKEVGITLMDSATYYITVGHFQDDEHWTQLKTLLCQFRPVEIVIDLDNVRTDLMRILKSGYLVPVISYQNNKNKQWHHGEAFNYLENKYGNLDNNNSKLPEVLKNYYNQRTDSSKEHQSNLLFQSLSGLFTYLKSVLILGKVTYLIKNALKVEY